jgi:glycosyltransferase involved in cell wall biosynthesis
MLNTPGSRVDELHKSSAEPLRSYRVLMIAPTSFFADYGCHVRILEEAQALTTLGHAVTIATYHNGGPVPGLDIRRTLAIPWRRDYVVGSSRHKVAFDALLGLKVTELLGRGHFDVIHAHLHEGALIGLVLGRVFGRPVLFDFQGSMTAEMLDHHFLHQESPLYRLLVRLETAIDHRAPVILTSTSHAQCLLVEQFGCDPARVRGLPDAVNTDVFRPADTYASGYMAGLRAHLGIPEDRRLIVYLGLLAEYQGTGLLLEAVRHLAARRSAAGQPPAHLLLMGFPNENVYRQRAAALGIADYVTFTGRVPYERAPEMLALGDVGVSAKLSLTEGAGKLLNYMACALPTVAFDTPVAREYLGYEGLYATRGDPASLAEQFEHVLFPNAEAVDHYRRLGLRLRQRAMQQFGWDRAGRQIVDTYRELTGGDAARIVTRPGLPVARK